MAITNTFFKRHSVAVNATTNIILVLLCAISYVVLFVLYFRQGMEVESFTYVGKGTLPPTTAIPLLGVLLTGATSALLTRSVEHNLWTNLIRGRPESRFYKEFDRNEPYQRAQWTISPFSRLLYVFSGRSWLLRVSGVLLFGTALLNPILLYGLSSIIPPDKRAIERSLPKFAGFTDSSDKTMIIASLAAMNSLGVPVTSYCTNTSCSVEAHAAAVQAECVTSQKREFPEGFTTFCSTFGEELCVDLGTSSPFAWGAYNFTSGSGTQCTSNPNTHEVLKCPAGDFAVIIGAWANFYQAVSNSEIENGAGYTANTVDCRVRYGTSTIVQTGVSTPYIQHDSFKISAISLAAEDEAYRALEWQSIYLTSRSPFTFASAGDDDIVFDVITASLIQSELPNIPRSAPFTNDTNRVARALERSFDTATLLAFVQTPEASTIVITNFSEIAIWTYDVKVLAILAAPLLATLLVLSRHWKVQSNYIVIGYDPLKIARRANEILASTIPSD